MVKLEMIICLVMHVMSYNIANHTEKKCPASLCENIFKFFECAAYRNGSFILEKMLIWSKYKTENMKW